MSENDAKGGKGGWTDRELLLSLLYLVQKNGITFKYEDGCYPAGRNASGFKQKLNHVKNAFKPEWDAMEAGTTISVAAPKTATPKKTATPRKRKAKTDEDDDDGASSEATPKKTATPRKRKAKIEGNNDANSEATPKKGRGRPKKKAATPEAEEDPENITVKGGSEDIESDV